MCSPDRHTGSQPSPSAFQTLLCMRHRVNRGYGTEYLPPLLSHDRGKAGRNPSHHVFHCTYAVLVQTATGSALNSRSFDFCGRSRACASGRTKFDSLAASLAKPATETEWREAHHSNKELAATSAEARSAQSRFSQTQPCLFTSVRPEPSAWSRRSCSHAASMMLR